MTSDNFIVRIYRRNMNQPDQLVGQVEDVDRGRTQPFQTMEKLWHILAGKKTAKNPVKSERIKPGVEK